MNQGESEPEVEMGHAAELRAAETLVPLVRLLAARTSIGLVAATLVALDSVAGPQDVLPGFLYGPIDFLAKATLLLLVRDTAATGFTLVCPQADGVGSPSTEVSTKRRWLS